MKKLNQALILAGLALGLLSTAGNLSAQERQGRGNFDLEQMRTRMMERYREQLEVKSDDEWKLISERITKVSDARREIGFGGGRGGFGGRRGGDDRGGNNNDANARRTTETTNVEAEALQKAIEAKAPADEIKAKLAKFREARKDKEAKLAKAQDELRKVLSVRQEASAVMMGLLQ